MKSLDSKLTGSTWRCGGWLCGVIYIWLWSAATVCGDIHMAAAAELCMLLSSKQHAWKNRVLGKDEGVWRGKGSEARL